MSLLFDKHILYDKLTLFDDTNIQAFLNRGGGVQIIAASFFSFSSARGTGTLITLFMFIIRIAHVTIGTVGTAVTVVVT